MATPAPQQTGHGIQNARVNTADERFTELAEGRLARAQFLKGNNSKRERFAANDPTYEGGGQSEGEEDQSMPSSAQALGQRTNAIRGRMGSTPLGKTASKNVKKRATIAAQPYIFWIACLSYIFQGLLGLMSLSAFYGGGLIDSSLWTSWINTLVDATKGLQAVGNLLWGISVLIVCGTFLSFLLWYKIIGHNPFHSIMSTFITILALSLSLLPVMNLFPWLVLWIIYMNITAIFSKS